MVHDCWAVLVLTAPAGCWCRKREGKLGGWQEGEKQARSTRATCRQRRACMPVPDRLSAFLELHQATPALDRALLTYILLSPFARPRLTSIAAQTLVHLPYSATVPLVGPAIKLVLHPLSLQLCVPFAGSRLAITLRSPRRLLPFAEVLLVHLGNSSSFQLD